MTEQTNQDRAMRAERYMMEYADEVGDDDMETALTDMLADIMHLPSST